MDETKTRTHSVKKRDNMRNELRVKDNKIRVIRVISVRVSNYYVTLSLLIVFIVVRTFRP